MTSSICTQTRHTELSSKLSRVFLAHGHPTSSAVCVLLTTSTSMESDKAFECIHLVNVKLRCKHPRPRPNRADYARILQRGKQVEQHQVLKSDRT